MHRLITPPFLDPRWFHAVRAGRHTGRATSSYEVELQGQTLRLAMPTNAHLTPGQEVFIVLNGSFFCETQEEYQERQRKVQERREQEERKWREQKNQWRAEAEAFNATLSIPVPWKSGMKDVLSGLSENSYGDGRNTASVTHIWLQEDLHDGRFHRSKGDFLCTSASGNNGRQWSAQPEDYCFDGDGNPYQAKVTCKACLKLARKWNHEGESNQ